MMNANAMTNSTWRPTPDPVNAKVPAEDEGSALIAGAGCEEEIGNVAGRVVVGDDEAAGEVVGVEDVGTVVVGDGGGVATLTTVKPEAPFPVTWPGLESPTNVYRGEPPYVTWYAPLGWSTAATVPEIPGPALGVAPVATVSGGQTAAELPVHVPIPLLSPE